MAVSRVIRKITENFRLHNADYGKISAFAGTTRPPQKFDTSRDLPIIRRVHDVEAEREAEQGNRLRVIFALLDKTLA